MITHRFLRHVLIGAALLVVLSCERSSPLGVESKAPTADLLSWAPSVGLLRCSPLPADSVTQTIGPDGGTLSVGTHRLTIPAGALAVPVTITAIAPSDTVNQVRFFPEGLTFASPALLTMSYANCGLLYGLVPKQIAYTTDDLNILALLPSIDDFWRQRVTGSLQHFSTYAIAW
jgi:hypothetical protein